MKHLALFRCALFLLCVPFSLSLKPVRFSATLKTKSAPFLPGKKPVVDWLRKIEAVEILLGAADTIQREDQGVFRIVTAGPAFPGLSVFSENCVRVECSIDSISLTLLDSSTTAKGAPPLVAIFRAAQQEMALRSVNEIKIMPAESDIKSNLDVLEGSYQFSSSVVLELDMMLPRWVPQIGMLEKQGSLAFQRMLDKDVARLLEKYRDEYVAWSNEASVDAQ